MPYGLSPGQTTTGCAIATPSRGWSPAPPRPIQATLTEGDPRVKLRRTALTTALAVTTALLTAMPATATPTERAVTATSFSYGGRGCPTGTAHTTISEDRQTVTFLFDAYAASTGPGVPAANRRTACQINILFDSDLLDLQPQADITTAGSSNLGTGTQSQIVTTAFFAGESDLVSRTDDYTGPTNNNYTHTLHANGPLSLGGQGRLVIKQTLTINPPDTTIDSHQTVESITINLRGLLG